jgi:site-specific recombinase XerD
MSSDLTLLPVGGAAAGLTDALTSAAGYALGEKADATRRAYRADIRRFSTWCEAMGAIALPATPETVAAYLAALADLRLKVSTISRRAAAIAYAHKLASFEPPINESVKAVMRGVRRKLGTAQKGKAPATAAVVAKLVKRIPDDLSGKRDKALVLIGFAAALRRSELVALTLADVERAPDGIVLHVRRSKTDQDGQGDQIAVPNGRKLKPVEALDVWLEAAAIRQGPIFRRVMKSGRLGHALTTQSVALIVKRWAKAARVDSDSFSGHSLRAGFVTSALEDGADLFKVMDITRHREVKTLKAYDRRAKAFRDHAGKGFL